MAERPAPPRGFTRKPPPIQHVRTSPPKNRTIGNPDLVTISDKAAEWARDGWAASPGEKRQRSSVLPFAPAPLPKATHKRQNKKTPHAAAAKSSGASSSSVATSTTSNDIFMSSALANAAAAVLAAQQPTSAPPPLLPPPVPAPAPPPPAKPGWYTLPVVGRVASEDDPEAWVADGWMAAPGAKRESRPVLETIELPAPRRTADPAAVAARAAVTAQLVVGSRCETRYLASVHPKWEKKTHWYPGKIDAVHSDGTYNVSYDDGDFEANVKRRFVRLPKAVAAGAPHSSAAAAACAAGGGGAEGEYAEGEYAEGDYSDEDDDEAGAILNAEALADGATDALLENFDMHDMLDYDYD